MGRPPKPHKKAKSKKKASFSQKVKSQALRGRQVVGIHACREVLKVRPKAITEAWVKKGELQGELKKLVEDLEQRRIALRLKESWFLDEICSGHQGIAIFVEEVPELSLEGLKSREEPTLLVMIDQITDPHNFGAILRTSWLMGVQGVFIPDRRSVGLTPAVHKVACGGVEHVPVEFVTQLGAVVEELKKQGFWIYGLSHEAKHSLWEQKFPEKVVWVVGAEDRGLRKTVENCCDELVSIPQAEVDASYNASVATGMALAETCRQQRNA